MNRLKFILVALAGAIAWTASAQDTNLWKTQIGTFETRTDVTLVKGFGQIGSLAVGSEQLSVRCKATRDLTTGEKVYGLAVELGGGQYAPVRVLVDDDEVDALFDSINSLMRINYDVTPLPGFEASFTTRGGFKVIAHSDRREGGILTFVQLGDYPRVPLSSVQMGQLSGLIEQARKNLATIKSGK